MIVWLVRHAEPRWEPGTALGWSDPLGYLSDLGIGGLLIALLYRRPWWLALPVLLFWCALTLASIELVSAVGRMPTPSASTTSSSPPKQPP